MERRWRRNALAVGLLVVVSPAPRMHWQDGFVAAQRLNPQSGPKPETLNYHKPQR